MGRCSECLIWVWLHFGHRFDAGVHCQLGIKRNAGNHAVRRADAIIAWGSGVRVRVAAVVTVIKIKRNLELMALGFDGCVVCSNSGAAKSGKNHGRQKADHRDDDDEFNEGKAALCSCVHAIDFLCDCALRSAGA